LVTPVALRWVALVAVLTVGVPAVAIAASSPTDGPGRSVFQDDNGNFILTPIDKDVELQVRHTDAGELLDWTSGGPWRADVFYRVYRSEGPDLECEHSDGSTAVYCYVRSVPIASTRDTTFLDPAPPSDATYRIGVGTNWLDDDTQGDIFAFSQPEYATP
jgi:hypothetical protein